MIRNTLPRETYAKWTEIDLDALRHNLGRLRRACRSNTRIMGVVKANAYGHNVSLIAPALFEAGVRDFGIATLGEALYLREILPAAEQILILGALAEAQYRSVIEAGFDFLLHTVAHIPLLERLAQTSGRAARLHLKIDTGMGRVGILPEEVSMAFDTLQQTEFLDLRGICSHLATSDLPDSGYVELQLQRFEQVREQFRAHALSRRFTPLFHLANSDAVFQYPETHFDMVRPGISLYGYGSVPAADLQPVLALKGRIVQFKQVPKGSPLGYGRTFVTQRLSRLGIVSIGYADGLSRLLSNRQDVLVAGQRVPIVGRISMDQCTVDLTDLPQWMESGLEVVLIGSSGEQCITAEDWAAKLDTIPYEVLTSLGTRLPRYPKD